jgi:MoCo/4Fe-4S cofactor protein with predicted Tat translocation signal
MSQVTRDPFWRTLDELADDPAFQERLHNEFRRRSKPSPIRLPDGVPR